MKYTKRQQAAYDSGVLAGKYIKQLEYAACSEGMDDQLEWIAKLIDLLDISGYENFPEELVYSPPMVYSMSKQVVYGGSKRFYDDVIEAAKEKKADGARKRIRASLKGKK